MAKVAMIELAIAAHRAWVERFRQLIEQSAVDGIESLQIASSNDCEFGQWLYGEAASVALGESLFMKIVVLHQNFHRAANKVAESLIAGDSDTLLRLGDLENYSNLLVAELRSRFPE